MDRKERQVQANKLKAAFNLLWHKAEINFSKEKGIRAVTYQDMLRITDAMRCEGPNILELETFPNTINSGFMLAIATLDMNKARSEKLIKQALSGLSGAGGLTLAWVSLGQLLNPGMWAVIVAFFVGGIPGGPLPVVGIGAGLLLAAGAVFAAFQDMSPEERSQQAYKCVIQAIDTWEEHGSNDKKVSYKVAKEFVRKSIDLNISAFSLTDQNIQSFFTLMMSIARADGRFVPEEREVIAIILHDAKAPVEIIQQADALNDIKNLDSTKINQVTNWLFQVAQSDGVFHPKETELLYQYCQTLNIDFESKAKKYGI